MNASIIREDVRELAHGVTQFIDAAVMLCPPDSKEGAEKLRLEIEKHVAEEVTDLLSLAQAEVIERAVAALEAMKILSPKDSGHTRVEGAMFAFSVSRNSTIDAAVAALKGLAVTQT